MVERVIFIRPGETDWNHDGRYQGWVAIPLNEIGTQQVQRLARFVRNIGLSALYSSDLKRAVQTTEIIAKELDFEPIYDKRLRERNIGEWQGVTQEQLKQWYPQEYEAMLKDIDGYQVPAGESRKQAGERMLEMFQHILSQDAGESVGIVTHTTAMRSLFERIIPKRPKGILELVNMSVTTIARDGNAWKFVRLNDVSHLEGFVASASREPEE